MPKAKFKITKKELSYSKKWIENKLHNFDFPYSYQKEEKDFTLKNTQAKEEFEKLQLKDNPKYINTWCETFLNQNQWQRLKNAIRAERSREKRRDIGGERIKRVDLTYKAYLILSALSRRDNVTLSETIINYLETIWNDLPDHEKYPVKHS